MRLSPAAPATPTSDAADGEPAASGKRWRLADKRRLGEDLRALVTPNGSDWVIFHKDPIDFGAEAQIFTGVRDGRPVVLRRLNALDFHTVGGIRAQLGAERARRRAAAHPLQDTRPLGDIERDVRLSATVAALRGQPFAALATRRGPQGPISKVFELIEPRQGDLLEAIVRLGGEASFATRAAVAGTCIGSLAADLERLAQAGITHGDLREENVLLSIGGRDAMTIESGDFGFAQEVPPGLQPDPADMAALGRLALVMLMPEERPRLVGKEPDLDGVLERLRGKHRDWAALVDDLLAGTIASKAAVHTRLALLGATGQRARERAHPVLAAVRAKADEMRERLAAIAAFAGGTPTPDAGDPLADPWGRWPASLAHAAAAKLRPAT